jgi:ribosomal protein S18 acetylase RimI-like enzyme
MTKPALTLQAPALLAKRHDLTGFASGEQALDDWLRQRARASLENGASRSYVVCPAGEDRVVGYYTLAMGQILNREAPAGIRRDMPAKTPAVILSLLAVDRAVQGRGLGRSLQDAVVRSLRAAQVVAARLMIVHAISPAAEAFYSHYGFTRIAGEFPALALDLIKVKTFGDG